MAKYRMGRINDEVQKAAAEIMREVKDPRVAKHFVSVTGAEVTADLKYARIWFSVLGSTPEKIKEVKAGLRSSMGFFRKSLSSKVDLRITPELTFIEDTSIANGAHIASLLESVADDLKDDEDEGDGEES